jgi:hypothetical protein
LVGCIGEGYDGETFVGTPFVGDGAFATDVAGGRDGLATGCLVDVGATVGGPLYGREDGPGLVVGRNTGGDKTGLTVGDRFGGLGFLVGDLESFPRGGGGIEGEECIDGAEVPNSKGRAEFFGECEYFTTGEPMRLGNNAGSGVGSPFGMFQPSTTEGVPCSGNNAGSGVGSPFGTFQPCTEEGVPCLGNSAGSGVGSPFGMFQPSATEGVPCLGNSAGSGVGSPFGMFQPRLTGAKNVGS